MMTQERPSGHWQNNGEKTLSVASVTKQKQTFSIASEQQERSKNRIVRAVTPLKRRFKNRDSTPEWAEERQLDSQCVKLSKYSLA